MATTQAPARTSPPGTARPTPPEQKRLRPITGWAIMGFGFLAFAAYLIIAWLVAGEPGRVGTGATPVPTWMKIALSVQQYGLFGGMLALVWFKAVRPKRKTGQVPLDGLIVISFALMWWSDPLYNYFSPGFNYNAYFINAGSWIGHTPGWMSPNATEIPQPLLWLPGVYTCAFFLMVLIASTIMRRTRQRFPAMSPFGLCAVAFVPMFFVGTFWEALFMMMGSHQYGSGISWLTINHGHYYGFPVYQGITASLLYVSWGALRFFRDDKGRSFAEAGIERLNVAPRAKGAMRFFAVSGAITTIFFVFYHVPNALIAQRGDAWPQDVQERSYFINGVCGPGTDTACPDPHLPLPRGDSSIRIGPDGKVVVPDGVTVPVAPAVKTS